MRTHTIGGAMSNHWQGTTSFPNNFGDDIKSHATFRILFKIMTFANYQLVGISESKAFSVGYIEKIAKVSRGKASDALKELEELGYITKIKESTIDRPAEFKISSFYTMERKVTHEEGIQKLNGGYSKNVPKK